MRDSDSDRRRDGHTDIEVGIAIQIGMHYSQLEYKMFGCDFGDSF